jgi:putative transposase
MTKPLHPIALFRLSVLGPLASRDHFPHGELNKLLNELASHTYQIPGSKRTHLSRQVIERWYYAWQKGGIEALEPKIRCDKQRTHLSEAVQAALLTAKRENPARSLNTLISLLEAPHGAGASPHH